MVGFIPFPRVLVLCEMQSFSSRIWTRVAVSISYDDNHYITGTSISYVVNAVISCCTFFALFKCSPRVNNAILNAVASSSFFSWHIISVNVISRVWGLVHYHQLHCALVHLSAWPVGWGCRIHRLLLCWRIRPPPSSVLVMTLNNLIFRFQ